MKTKKETFEVSTLWEEIPEQISDSEVLVFLQNRVIDWRYVETIKKQTDFNDDVIGDWLSITRKTFRSYRQTDIVFKVTVQEHILLLLVLIKRGIQLFGDTKEFDQWLNTQNFFFDNHRPVLYLTTVSGIRFVNDRLTAMEFGDNV